MFKKLALRNVRRSIGDYFVYIFTMVFIVSLMFSFNSMIFDDKLKIIIEEPSFIAAMIGVATFFIVIIFIWLINYMIRFIFEKRSQEFSIYSLIGFKKNKIIKIFFIENISLGIISFILGVIIGVFIQQMLYILLYSFLDMEYKFAFNIKIENLFLTFGIFFISYIIGLYRTGRKIRKLDILNMMNLERKGEEKRNSNKTWRSVFFYLAIIFFVVFYSLLFLGKINIINIWILTFGFILSMYFLYMGISSFLVKYLKRGGRKIWKGSNIFLLRQFSSKIRTMEFTLGTLAVIFSVALIGSSCGFMINELQKRYVEEKFVFDIGIYNKNPEYDFTEQINKIKDTIEISDVHEYKIYKNGKDQFNQICLENFPGAYEEAYFKYDTYMKLSDYNYLRNMLGYAEINLNDDEYYIHIKEQLDNYIESFKNIEVNISNKKVRLAGYKTEPFQQGGFNGADYIIVVSDKIIENLTPYYSLVMVSSDEKDLNKLKKLEEPEIKTDDEWDEYEKEYYEGRGLGSEMILSGGLKGRAVKEVEISQMKGFVSFVIFPLLYIGIVYSIVALAILSTQQLSEFNKYKYSYNLLNKLGMNSKELKKIIFKQIGYYYSLPFITSVLISGGLIIYLSDNFIYYTGLKIPVISFFLGSLLIYGGIYILYFIATYISSKRNIIYK
ncbi:MAG: ABC transporter permease [Miniphocaeibacter sp.]|uniref:ABC transporter permease n=1 Tax=Miniphocaeibacter sp. TaxID=3100973 RepID=UPI00182B5357|nr:ABC transporter permease [Gallicola sp.]